MKTQQKKIYHTKQRPIESICKYKFIPNQIHIGDQWIDPVTQEVWEYKVISTFVVKSCHWVKLNK